MEELDFFEEICLTSLYATKAVKFAAVVDSNGKMVTGKIRRIHGRGREGSAKMANSSKWTGGGYSFYHHYLIPSLNNRATTCWFDWGSNKSHFEITEIATQEENNNRKVFLAVTPLTQTKDKFLCIYLQMPSETPNQHQQIISRLCEAIQ
ncbi:MAG: hypothetical protein FIO02_07075 [Nitrosopumilales archaeon]|jgi:hypothetical protein|nr:hypothetical protein [Nitrosopumilales archaeon]